MALTDTYARFLFYSKSIGVSFAQTMTIGRLALKINPLLADELIRKYNLPADNSNLSGKEIYAEAFFKMLGANITDSIDYSDYEGASITHDMNYPIPSSYKNKYSVVIDGGSLEHIFNFPVAIQNCMNMIRTDGHFISFAPLNNLMGHGFYQFSPEIFYRVFSSENGFKVEKMFMVAADYYTDVREWYSVTDPKEIKERVLLSNTMPTYVMLLARKIKDAPLFTSFPNQADYVSAWKNADGKTELTTVGPGGLRSLYRKLIGEKTRYRIRKFYNKYIRGTEETENLERVNNRFFKKFRS